MLSTTEYVNYCIFRSFLSTSSHRKLLSRFTILLGFFYCFPNKLCIFHQFSPFLLHSNLSRPIPFCNRLWKWIYHKPSTKIWYLFTWMTAWKHYITLLIHVFLSISKYQVLLSSLLLYDLLSSYYQVSHRTVKMFWIFLELPLLQPTLRCYFQNHPHLPNAILL